MKTTRRQLMQYFLATAGSSVAWPINFAKAQEFGSYSGRFLLTLQTNGGWDVTSFCDPKVNQPGELPITQWSDSGEVQLAGNIPYAPFASNRRLFENHFDKMLVINGVDMQTNSHTVGVLHSWSGRNSVGYPSITAMFAAQNTPDEPLAYINFGGFTQTSNLVRSSRLDNVENLRSLVVPEQEVDPGHTLRSAGDISRIHEYRNLRLQRIASRSDILGRQRTTVEAFQQAMSNKSRLSRFLDFLPSDDEFIGEESLSNRHYSKLRGHIQLAISAFSAGISSAADLFLDGFDTHSDNDSVNTLLFNHLADSLDLLWQMAEEQGIADRLTVVIGSDFGRTPHYNADNGKDHWPIGSVIVMEKNANWTNRAVGLTDEGHNAYRINHQTLERDDANGSLIYPRHVHKALRNHLGLSGMDVSRDFPFGDALDFTFFS